MVLIHLVIKTVYFLGIKFRWFPILRSNFEKKKVTSPSIYSVATNNNKQNKTFDQIFFFIIHCHFSLLSPL